MRIVSLLFVGVVSCAIAGTVRAAEPAAPGSADGASTQAVSSAPSTEPSALGPMGYDAKGQRGRVHTVVTGDTLWDLSDAYLGTPWAWPSIWKDNPDVPNPHRIYPGDRVWISPTEMRRISDAEAAQLLENQGEMPASYEDAGMAPLRTFTVPTIDSVGFVSADQLTASGSILGSDIDVHWYGAEMPVYLSLGEGQVEKGDRFSVVRTTEEVRDPETRHVLGSFIEQLGWVEVTKVHSESAEAVIRSSAQEMQAGDRILPRTDPDQEIPVRAGSVPVEGQIAFLANSRTINAGQDVVFLNRGSVHGLSIGSPLVVVRLGGEARDAETGLRRLLPDEVVADLVVVSAEPGSAVAVVAHAREELARGLTFRSASTR
jgi:hypothetical protein